MKRCSIYLFLLLFPLSKLVDAQQLSNEPENNLLNEFTFGALAHPRGYGINLKSSRYIGQGKHRFFELDLLSMKHPKEIRVRSNSFQSPGSYIYGKLNNTFFLRTGYGQRISLGKKLYKSMVSVDASFSAGPSIALLKPVYLEIFYPFPDLPDGGYLSSERYDPKKHVRQEDIFGASAFTRGLGQLSARAGGYVKASLVFDWGDYGDQVQAIEAGIVVDAFPNKLPMMVFAENKNVFTTLYICLNFGNRW